MNEKYGSKQPLKRSDITPSTKGNGEPKSSLELLELLTGPMLALLLLYLKAKNKSNKKIESLVDEFCDDHPDAFKTIFATDSAFRIFGVFIVIFVFCRGLGIIDFAFGR